jgi:hypothetical protein
MNTRTPKGGVPAQSRDERNSGVAERGSAVMEACAADADGDVGISSLRSQPAAVKDTSTSRTGANLITGEHMYHLAGLEQARDMRAL